MRLAFLGNARWSVPALEALADTPELDLTLVVTNPPRPAGRGSALTPTAVARAAGLRGMHLVEAGGVRSGKGLEELRSARPDVLVVVAYGELLSPEVLTLAPKGAINLHFSLLPRWRGAAPVQHALLAGDTTTGVTTMLMDEGLDTGPILDQRAEPIDPIDDAGSLGDRLASLGAQLLVETLRSWDDLVPRPQDDGLATAAPKLRPADRVLDWSQASVLMERRVRALSPEPGARTVFRGRPLLVTLVEPTDGSGEPGTILGTDDRGVLVATGDGAVRLRMVAPAGRRHMTALDWSRGARFGAGERLG
jgi:methionyl-tRNA formyltransferase